jgi:hypothetical protein
MWRETAWTYSLVLSRHYPGGIKEYNKYIRQINGVAVPRFEASTSIIKLEALQLKPTFSEFLGELSDYQGLKKNPTPWT